MRIVLCAPPSLWPAPSCAPIEKPPAAPAALGVASTFAPPKGDEPGQPDVPAAAPKSKPDGLAGASLLGRPKVLAADMPLKMGLAEGVKAGVADEVAPKLKQDEAAPTGVVAPAARSGIAAEVTAGTKAPTVGAAPVRGHGVGAGASEGLSVGASQPMANVCELDAGLGGVLVPPPQLKTGGEGLSAADAASPKVKGAGVEAGKEAGVEAGAPKADVDAAPPKSKAAGFASSPSCSDGGVLPKVWSASGKPPRLCCCCESGVLPKVRIAAQSFATPVEATATPKPLSTGGAALRGAALGGTAAFLVRAAPKAKLLSGALCAASRAGIATGLAAKGGRTAGAGGVSHAASGTSSVAGAAASSAAARPFFEKLKMVGLFSTEAALDCAARASLGVKKYRWLNGVAAAIGVVAGAGEPSGLAAGAPGVAEGVVAPPKPPLGAGNALAAIWVSLEVGGGAVACGRCELTVGAFKEAGAGAFAADCALLHEGSGMPCPGPWSSSPPAAPQSLGGIEKPPKLCGLAAAARPESAGAAASRQPKVGMALAVAATDAPLLPPAAASIAALVVGAGGISEGLGTEPLGTDKATAGTGARAALSAVPGGAAPSSGVGVASMKERSGGGSANGPGLALGAASFAASRPLEAGELGTARIGRVCRSGVSSMSRVRKMRCAATELALLLTSGGAPGVRRGCLALGSDGLPYTARSRLALGGGANGEARRPRLETAGLDGSSCTAAVLQEGVTSWMLDEGRPASEVSHVAAGLGVGAAAELSWRQGAGMLARPPGVPSRKDGAADAAL